MGNNGKPSRTALIAILEECVLTIVRVDGDRDYMNPSNLTVQQTTAIADYIGQAVAELEATSSP